MLAGSLVPEAGRTKTSVFLVGQFASNPRPNLGLLEPQGKQASLAGHPKSAVCIFFVLYSTLQLKIVEAVQQSSIHMAIWRLCMATCK